MSVTEKLMAPGQFNVQLDKTITPKESKKEENSICLLTGFNLNLIKMGSLLFIKNNIKGTIINP